MWLSMGDQQLSPVVDRQGWHSSRRTTKRRRHDDGCESRLYAGSAGASGQPVRAVRRSCHRLRHGRSPAGLGRGRLYRYADIAVGYSDKRSRRARHRSRCAHSSGSRAALEGRTRCHPRRGDAASRRACRRRQGRAAGVHAGYPFEMGTRRRWHGHGVFVLHDRRAFRRHQQAQHSGAVGGRCGRLRHGRIRSGGRCGLHAAVDGHQPDLRCAFRQLLHGITPAASKARISGTLIGVEIAGAMSSAGKDAAITLVVSGGLQALYETAFKSLSLSYQTIDADAAVRRGLSAAARALWPNDERANS